MAKLGASPVSLPGGQIYENLVSGAIDATEWVGPYNDYFLKFYEAAKYYYYPGMHEPGGNISFGFNKTFWEGLTDWERELIRTCAREEHANQMDETNANNGAYLNRLITEHGPRWAAGWRSPTWPSRCSATACSASAPERPGLVMQTGRGRWSRPLHKNSIRNTAR